MNKSLLNAISIIVVLLFVGAGILLITRSETIYNESLAQSNRMVDSALKNKAPLVIPPSHTLVKDGYGQALTFFMLAFGICLFVILLPRLQNISIGSGGINITLREVQKNVQTLMHHTNSLQSESTGAGGGKSNNLRRERIEKLNVQELASDDPQKNKWGGKSEINFRRIRATARNSQWPDLYVVQITVESTNDKFPLTGIVKFHLHNTFKNPNPVITVSDNKAVLELPKVYGAFTVGAEADDGATRLELDLSTLEGSPQGFREN